MRDTKKCQLILILSGKRKSGKDFITNVLTKSIGDENCHVMRVSRPIKSHFSKKYKLSFEELSSSSTFKETIREEMIVWGENQRKADVDIFCRMEKDYALTKQRPVWILSDARRPPDIKYFNNYAQENNIQFYSIRIVSDIETRKKRGWVFTKGVDSVDSECALDHHQFDVVFSNSNNDDIYETIKSFVASLNLNF